MNFAFTICSNNYLAKAKVVADTFIVHHPNYKFLFFLVDTLDDNLDYSGLENYQLIQIHEIVPNIEELAKKYNIIELNTAVKPAILLHLFKKLNSNTAIYLDPDLMIFDEFSEVEQQLSKDDINIVITPHFCSPIDDGKYPSEVDFAPFGLYNLGFIAIKNSKESQRFLEWWHNRLMKYCYIRPDKGMFTDQLWVNYAPLFFEGVQLLKHLGYNVANWNLYERFITETENGYVVNEKYRLKFFHFSHFQFDNPYVISRHQNRHTIEERPDVLELITEYKNRLIANQQVVFSTSVCYYDTIYLQHQEVLKKQSNTLKKRIRNKASSLFNRVLGE